MKPQDTALSLDTILSKPCRGQSLTAGQISFLLELSHPEQRAKLFRTARNLRHQYFGNEIFLYGFLYVSTYCRNDCTFCFFRRSNSTSPRYRKSIQQIVSAAVRLADAGVHLIDLTLGEDPALFDSPGDKFAHLVELVTAVSKATESVLMVSPGVMADHVLAQLGQAGTTWYACYQETHQRRLFDRLRPGQNFDTRLEAKVTAHRLGLLIEEGLLCGVGETTSDIVESMEVMRRLDADQIRVMNFVPQPQTPMAGHAPADPHKEMLIIAVMRLLFPDRLIPASLDVDGLSGLKSRLDAGANVVTSIVPPGRGLAGVARPDLDIDNGRRTTAAVQAVLKDCDLQPAGTAAYRAWTTRRRNMISGNGLGRKIA